MTYEVLDRVNPVMEQWEVIRELNLLDADPEQWSRINGLEPGRVTGIRPVA